MRTIFIAILSLLTCAPVVTQETMNDGSVLRLIWAQMSDDVIVNMIHSHPGNYDVSPQAILALKKAGASERVISAIITKASGATQQTGVPPSAPPAPLGAPSAPVGTQTSSVPRRAETNSDAPPAKEAAPARAPTDPDQEGTASGLALIPTGARVAIAPMGGFETYFAAAVREKRVPVILTLDKDSAQYFVVSTNTEWQGFVYGSGGGASWTKAGGTAGYGASASSTRGLEASIMLIDAKTKDVVWAYEVHKSSHGSLLFGTLGARGQQSVAEACAKHLKEYIENGK
jgi:hypothetical protein